jgi:AraC-like DNA-binding protein
VEVAYISVHMADFDFGLFEKGERRNYVSIHYCKEGRIEQEVNQEFFYLMPGDCSIAIHDKAQKMFQLPLKHYHGMSIGIDLNIIQNPLMSYLESCDCSPLDALQHICGGMSHIVLRSSEVAMKFFGELYDADCDQCLDYLRVKMPELFYRMKYAKTNSRYYDRNLVPRTQVEIVKEVSDYITQNLNEKITLKQLTLEFGVSDTYLQNAFRSVYGMPVISFIRMQKMQCAAQVLIHTTRTVDEIAEEFGYENESKFSAAFKKIMGDTPGVYRKEHSKVKII